MEIVLKRVKQGAVTVIGPCGGGEGAFHGGSNLGTEQFFVWKPQGQGCGLLESQPPYVVPSRCSGKV